MHFLDTTLITSRLLLGAAPTNLDEELRQNQADEVARNGVGLVVDCRAGADDSELWLRRGIEYLNIGIDDSGEEVPLWFFSLGVEAVLEQWAGDDDKAFLHCEFGVARSPALALAVLLTDGMKPNDAIQTIHSGREQATSRYFESALRWFQWFSVPSDR